MKISKARLKTIILEELQNVMSEMDMLPMGSEDGMDSEDEERVKLRIGKFDYIATPPLGIERAIKDFNFDYGNVRHGGGAKIIGKTPEGHYEISVPEGLLDDFKDAIDAEEVAEEV